MHPAWGAPPDGEPRFRGSHFLGTNRIELDLTSTVAASMPRRDCDTVSELVREIVDARVWGGLHYAFPASTESRSDEGRPLEPGAFFGA